MISLFLSSFVFGILTSNAKRCCLHEDYRRNVVDFKLTWCETRMRRYDWKGLLGLCFKFVPWEARHLEETLQTRAENSVVKRMDIKPAGFFSRISFQSVSIMNTEKTFGGDSWRVNIRGTSNMAAMVFDNNDGSYEAVFLIEQPGFYWAEIILDYSLCEGFKDPPLDWFLRGNVNPNNNNRYHFKFNLSTLFSRSAPPKALHSNLEGQRQGTSGSDPRVKDCVGGGGRGQWEQMPPSEKLNVFFLT